MWGKLRFISGNFGEVSFVKLVIRDNAKYQIDIHGENNDVLKLGYSYKAMWVIQHISW